MNRVGALCCVPLECVSRSFVFELRPHTLNLFGTYMSNFLIGNLVMDIVLINMLDFLCIP